MFSKETLISILNFIGPESWEIFDSDVFVAIPMVTDSDEGTIK